MFQAPISSYDVQTNTRRNLSTKQFSDLELHNITDHSQSFIELEFEVPDPGVDNFDIVCSADRSRPEPSVTWFVGESLG